MHIWLPPTPPADSQPDYYMDCTLEMAYDTSTLMTPDELLRSAIYSEDDFDVFGLYKPPHETTFTEPLKKLQKAPTKFKREHTSIPQSLFWRRYTPDLLTTRIRKLSPQTKKVKGKAEQFTPLLDAQDGPEWLSTEDWILIKGLTATLEFPLSLNCTVPAQTPNWSILADLVSTYSKTKRSPLQCKDRLVGVVIPREEQINRNEDPESKKHKSRDVGQIKKYKNRRDQKTRTMVVQDKCRETTKLFGSCFHWIHMSSEKRNNQNKQNVNESVSRNSMHSELLLKEYDVNLDTVCSPMFLAQSRAERIQSEMPRNPQVHQLLTQPPQQSQQPQQPQAPPYTHLTQITRQLSANLKTSSGSANNTGTPTWPTTTPVITTTQQRVSTTSIQSTVATTSTTAAVSVATTTETPPIPTPIPSMPVTVKPLQTTPQSLPLSVASVGGGATPQTTTGLVSVPHSVTTPTTSSSISNAAAAAAAAAVAKTYSGVDLNKGILLNHRLTPQQILLLRQTALQHQQQLQKQQQAVVAAGLATPTTQVQRHIPQIVSTATTVQSSQPVQITTTTAQTGQTTPTIQTQPTLAKIQIPGIEQLRPTIALSNQRVQGALVRAAGLPARSMQTEEVLALLRQQQALRMAMQTQTAKLAAQQQQQQQLSQSTQQQSSTASTTTTSVSSTHTTTTGLSEAIAAAALAAAAVQQQQQQQQQTSKQSSKQPQQPSKQQPSVVSPAVKTTEPPQASLIDSNQLKVEFIERSQQPTSKQK